MSPPLLTRLDAALTAPDATPGEKALGYGAAVSGAGFVGVLTLSAGEPVWAVLLLALIGFDLFGGAVANATVSGSRRFHGADSPDSFGLIFVALHIHPLLAAALVPDMPWPTALAGYLGIVGGAAVMRASPSHFRAPIAFGAASILITLCVTVFLPAAHLAWLVPLLVVKLLLSHLLPHPGYSDR